MRYKPEQKQQTAANILAAAERGFRLGGYGGVGVDALAQEAGVTSGAFYKHFPSKAAVFEAAVNAGIQRYESNIEKLREEFGDEWLAALIDYYLGREHRSNIAEGCVVTGLSNEVARSSEKVRADFQAGLEKVAKQIRDGLSGTSAADRKRRAWVVLAMLAGGVILSRSVRDEKVADEISKAIHDAALLLK
ncbi:MAG: TetR/AcrR family transcriptional regulator [Spongiibacteraceae bacterium]